MKNRHLSSTDLKKKTAEILNLVAYGKITAVIERHGEPLVEIRPYKKNKKKTNLENKLASSFGSIKNFPEVTRKRFFRGKKVNW